MAEAEGGEGLDLSGQTVVQSAVIDSFRVLLEQIQNQIDKETWEELGMICESFAEKEKDFYVAAQIGQMLLKRNQELMNENNNMQIDFNDQMTMSEEKIGNFQQRNRELTRDLEEIRVKFGGELSRLEEENEKLRNDLKNSNEKLRENRQLIGDLERQHSDLDAENKKKSILVQNLKSPKKEDEQRHKELVQELEQLKSTLNELPNLQTANQKLHEQLKESRSHADELKRNLSQKEDLSEAFNSLVKANKRYQVQDEEYKQLISNQNQTIDGLQRALEEKQLHTESLFGMGPDKSSSLADELSGQFQQYNFAPSLDFELSQNNPNNFNNATNNITNNTTNNSQNSVNNPEDAANPSSNDTIINDPNHPNNAANNMTKSNTTQNNAENNAATMNSANINNDEDTTKTPKKSLKFQDGDAAVDIVANKDKLKSDLAVSSDSFATLSGATASTSEMSKKTESDPDLARMSTVEKARQLRLRSKTKLGDRQDSDANSDFSSSHKPTSALGNRGRTTTKVLNFDDNGQRLQELRKEAEKWKQEEERMKKEREKELESKIVSTFKSDRKDIRIVQGEDSEEESTTPTKASQISPLASSVSEKSDTLPRTTSGRERGITLSRPFTTTGSEGPNPIRGFTATTHTDKSDDDEVFDKQRLLMTLSPLQDAPSRSSVTTTMQYEDSLRASSSSSSLSSSPTSLLMRRHDKGRILDMINKITQQIAELQTQLDVAVKEYEEERKLKERLTKTMEGVSRQIRQLDEFNTPGLTDESISLLHSTHAVLGTELREQQKQVQTVNQRVEEKENQILFAEETITKLRNQLQQLNILLAEEELDDFALSERLLSTENKESLVRELIKLRSKLRVLREDEEKFVNVINGFRSRLADSSLDKMNSAMKRVLTFKELIQLSNTCIDSVIRDSLTLLIPPEKKLYHLVNDLLQDSALLRKQSNDLGEGIVRPTLEKLDALKNPKEPPPKPAQSPQPERRSGWRSFLPFGRSRTSSSSNPSANTSPTPKKSPK